MEITEKVAYLKGLMEGMNYDKDSNEGKLFTAILDVLGDVSHAVADLETGVSAVAEHMELIDEELEEVLEDLYDDDECGCGCHDLDDDEYEGELYEVTCPSCGDTICVDEDMLDEGEIKCPGCGEDLEFDLDGIIEECSCEDE